MTNSSKGSCATITPSDKPRFKIPMRGFRARTLGGNRTLGGSRAEKCVEVEGERIYEDAVKTPEECPNCGADVPQGARACPECGADEHTGWSEEAETPGNLGIPEDSFDYEDFVKREFDGETAPDEKRRHFWRMVGLIVLLCFALPVGYWLIAGLLGGTSR